MRREPNTPSQWTKTLVLLSVLLGSGESTGICSGGPRAVGNCASYMRKCCCHPVASKPACCCRVKSESPVPISPPPAGTNRELRSIEWFPWANAELLSFAAKVAVLNALQEQRVMHTTSAPSVQTLFCIWQT